MNNPNMKIYGIQCKEDWFPGMWQRWYKAQCAAVGWPGEKLNGPTKDKSWSSCREKLKKIEPGDWIVVQLKDRRIARLGEVIKLEIRDDQWDPLVYQRKNLPQGDMGRRIIVRWDLENSPPDPDIVVQFPPKDEAWIPVRRTINEITDLSLHQLKEIAKSPDNWVSLTKRFKWETELSDYIAAFPHKLEDGLLPYPDKKIREHKFPDGTQLDVLLEDKNQYPVVVECKQHPPNIDAIRQLHGYMKHVEKEFGKTPRGILCFGGARRVTPQVRDAAEKIGKIEFVHYSLVVNFSV